MGIRPGRAIRDTNKVVWSRYSRSKPRKSYVKAMPHRHLTVFRMGKNAKDYNLILNLVAKQSFFHRDNAIEAARKSVNGFLEKKLLDKYYLIINYYPHHVVRENKMVTGAGADRIQQGMRGAFGKPMHTAAMVKKDANMFTLKTYKENEKVCVEALERAAKKLSGNYKIKKEALNG